MSFDPESKAARREWLVIIAMATFAVALGGLLGFVSRALLPVKTFAKLPDPNAAKGGPLPEVYWLRQYTSKGVGSAREKEKAIKAGLATSLTDREIALWLNRTFAGVEGVKEDIDAKLGTPFVRIGGRRPGEAGDPELTVTMPFKLKVLSLPVSEVPLQFAARPAFDGDETGWEISDVWVGHARVPSFIASGLVPKAVAEILESKPAGREMRSKLGAYRRVTIRDGKLFLEAPHAGAGAAPVK